RAIDVLEAEGVAIVAGTPPTVVAAAGELPAGFRTSDRSGTAMLRAAAAAPPGRSIVSRPLTADAVPTGRLVAVFRGRPLCLDDDRDLVSLLGSMTARAVDREGAIAELEQTRAALAESTALQASEIRFRALLDEHPNGVVVADEEGRIVFANR